MTTRNRRKGRIEALQYVDEVIGGAVPVRALAGFMMISSSAAK